jgi:hypothetical protein
LLHLLRSGPIQGFPASGTLDQIAERVSSIVWLDAFKPNDGEKVVDFAWVLTRRWRIARTDKSWGVVETNIPGHVICSMRQNG